jgi:hypothetical protein
MVSMLASFVCGCMLHTPLLAGMTSFCVARNIASRATGRSARYDNARCVSVVLYMFTTVQCLASACSRSTSRFVNMSLEQNNVESIRICVLTYADSSWPIAGVRCMTVTSSHPGMPMLSAAGTWSAAPENKGENTACTLVSRMPRATHACTQCSAGSGSAQARRALWAIYMAHILSKK